MELDELIKIKKAALASKRQEDGDKLNLYSNYNIFSIRFKVYAIKWLIKSLQEDAINSNEHRVANTCILLQDALREGGLG